MKWPPVKDSFFNEMILSFKVRKDNAALINALMAHTEIYGTKVLK